MNKLLENKLFKVCLIAIITIILIMVIVILFVANGSKRLSQTMLINAAKRYYEMNTMQLPKENYATTRVALSTLVANGYINDQLEGLDCPSYVTATNMNGTYEYNAVILCDNTTRYTTPLINKLGSTIVTEGSGLYNYKGSYIYRGENPNNYIKIGNLNYRIIGIEANNTIKIIYNGVYNEFMPWDDRYNKDTDDQKGINDYVTNEKSRIKEYLDSYFTNTNNGEEYTSKVISLLTPHTVCVGKVSMRDNTSNVCSKTLDNQLISTITVNDYINASLDKDCSLTNSINCQNYNYLNRNSWTLTANKDDSYTAFYISYYDGILKNYTSASNAVRPVLTLRNSVVYVSGTGTETDPYIIK